MMSLLKKQNPTSVLGLALDGGRLEAVLVRRTNGSAEVQQTVSVPLSLDLFKNEPELVGGEIRNQLDAAEIRERRCVVSLPLDWTLVLHTRLPDLPESDVASFLEIEAERGFPVSPEHLLICRTRYCTRGGEAWATQVAVPRDRIERLELALEAAALRPVSISLGITALQPADDESAGSVLALSVGEAGVDLLITHAGGVAALRALEGAFETEGAEKRLQAGSVARELRITLGQLPAEVREGLRQVRVFGRGTSAPQLALEVRASAAALGLQVEHVTSYAAMSPSLKVAAGTVVSASLSLALRQLSGRGTGFEFLPPKVSAWRQFHARYASKKLAYAGAAAATVALLVAGAFAFQQWQLAALQTKWVAMKPRVEELAALQQQIKKFRPWFDESLTGLSILRRLTEAFPEDGSVAAKTVEIRNLSIITCTGTARDNAALLKAMEQLRTVKEINDVKVDSIRGKSPLQFTLNFHWGAGGQP